MIFKLIYIPWIIGILLASYFLIKAIIRIVKGIISFRRLGKKEFMIRLKDGFDSITPTQKTRGELRGMVISEVGLLLGTILSLVFRIKGMWIAIFLTFLGGFLVTLFGLIGKIQQYRVYRKQDKIMEELEKSELYDIGKEAIKEIIIKELNKEEKEDGN